jgi:hypothetical protein
MFNPTIDNLSEWNAQLYRELKGKLNPRNLSIAVSISLVVQGFIFLIYQSNLPYVKAESHRYCLGQFSGTIDPEHYNSEYYKGINFCVKDALGNLTINWPLWNLDLFICLSIIAIFTLIIAGSYLLIADLTKEEEKGTLNFIRLSPETAKNFFIGKILGVPSLIYLVILIGLPFHLITGLSAKITFDLILSFYAILVVSCTFFYSLSLLYSLTFTELVGFKIWFGSGILLFALYLLAIVSFNSESLVGNVLDWSLMFYPGTVLTYLVKSTNLDGTTVNYLSDSMWDKLTWFRLPLWKNYLTGIGFILVHYLVGIYWIGIGLTRRFYNPDAQILTKKQSYFLTIFFTFIMLGFSVQIPDTYSNYFDNFSLLLSLNFIFCLGLVIILSPQRQTLQDWSRYRHQTPKKIRNLLIQLIWNNHSPSTLAIVINYLISSIIYLPAIFFLSVGNERLALILGLIVQLSLLVLFTTVTQLLLMLKTKKRNLFALSGLAVMIFFPLITALIFQLEPKIAPLIWLFSVVPMIGLVNFQFNTFLFSILGQVGAIALLNLQMTKQLQKLGESKTFNTQLRIER